MSAQRVVLLPLDGSEAAKTALPAARGIAKAGDRAEIALLHILQGHPVSDEELRHRLGISQVDTAGCRLLQAAGSAATEISRIANEYRAWVIVMSTQAETAARQARFGGTLAAVIENANRAVLAVRPDMPESRRTLGKISRILLPLDGSPAAAAAVHAALDFTHEFGARLQLLHVPLSAKAPPEQPGTLVGPKYIDAPHHEWPAWTDEFVRRFGPGERAESELVEFHAAPGDPGEQILRFAEEHSADLIGIAWRQKLDPGRAEIVKRLLAESQCPLLFVPAATRESM